MSQNGRHQELSPNRKALQRLLRNKPSVFGLVVIFISVVIAILGYGITPDSTPNANDQVNEINFKPPGYTTKLLLMRKNRDYPNQGFLSKLFFGESNVYKRIPITGHQMLGDRIEAQIYQGEGMPSKRDTFSFVDVVFKLTPKTADGHTSMLLLNAAGTLMAPPSNEKLRASIENTHLIEQTFLLGTDRFGRDMFSRLLIGVRISLSVGLIAVLISLTIGISLGAMAGYFGGRTDSVIMLLINTMWSVPTLLLVFALVLALGRGYWQIFTAVGLTMWVDVARVVRGQVMTMRKVQFVEAAYSFGFSHARIIGKHILPNILGPVMVISAANFSAAILIEAGLSYLGFGIQPPQPSWGTMLAENYSYLLSGNNPFPALVPGLAIMLMVLAFNLVGNGLRDALDVKGRE